MFKTVNSLAGDRFQLSISYALANQPSEVKTLEIDEKTSREAYRTYLSNLNSFLDLSIDELYQELQKVRLNHFDRPPCLMLVNRTKIYGVPRIGRSLPSDKN